MKATKLKETYYAVRIGDPPWHQPHFMIGDMVKEMGTPMLFNTREVAEQRALRVCPNTTVKIVRVTLAEE